jgi:hypothetical protein
MGKWNPKYTTNLGTNERRLNPQFRQVIGMLENVNNTFGNKNWT